MRKWFVVLIVFVAIPTLVNLAFRERVQNLPIQKTVVYSVSIATNPFSAFLPTDLDGDRKIELLALRHYGSPTLILHPFDYPKTLQLPSPVGDLSNLTPTLRMKRYPTSQMTWLRLEGARFVQEPFPPQIRGVFKGAKVVDASGNGVNNDLLVVMRNGNKPKRWHFTLDESGNWQFKGALSDVVFVRHPLFDRHLLISDLDGDGKAEIVKAQETISRWHLEIWRYEPVNKQRWCVATSPTFSVAPSWQLSGIDTLWAHDFDGDGLNEIVGIWFAGDSSSKYFLANIFAFKWQGKRLTMHRIRQRVKEPAFDIRPIFLCNPVFEHGGDLYFLLPKLLGFRLPLPHLISFNPPKFRWWIEVERIRTEIWLLPKGKDAFEPSKWRKITELPGEPLAVGDWDKDGRIEMFLRTGAISAESPKAVLARLHGKKLQRVEWHLGQMKLPTCVLPATEGSKSALFVGWNDGTIERIQWRK